jgi:hypothetical protein
LELFTLLLLALAVVITAQHLVLPQLAAGQAAELTATVALVDQAVAVAVAPVQVAQVLVGREPQGVAVIVVAIL